MTDPGRDRPLPPELPFDDWEVWDAGAGDQGVHLVDLINRVLDRGVVIHGEVTISVAGVDLVYLGLNALLTSVQTARESLNRRVPDLSRAPEPRRADDERPAREG